MRPSGSAYRRRRPALSNARERRPPDHPGRAAGECVQDFLPLAIDRFVHVRTGSVPCAAAGREAFHTGASCADAAASPSRSCRGRAGADPCSTAVVVGAGGSKNSPSTLRWRQPQPGAYVDVVSRCALCASWSALRPVRATPRMRSSGEPVTRARKPVLPRSRPAAAARGTTQESPASRAAGSSMSPRSHGRRILRPLRRHVGKALHFFAEGIQIEPRQGCLLTASTQRSSAILRSSRRANGRAFQHCALVLHVQVCTEVGADSGTQAGVPQGWSFVHSLNTSFATGNHACPPELRDRGASPDSRGVATPAVKAIRVRAWNRQCASPG